MCSAEQAVKYCLGMDIGAVSNRYIGSNLGRYLREVRSIEDYLYLAELICDPTVKGKWGEVD